MIAAHRESLVCLILIAVVAGISNAEPLLLSGPTMGTTYHVKIVDAQATDESSLRAGIEAVLADVDRRLSTYRRDSEISRFNRAPAGQWFTVSPETAGIVATAKQFSRQTDGALDVTVGPLVQLWHFGPDTIASAKSLADLAPPDESQIRAARTLVGYDKLLVRSESPALRKQVAGLEVDVSAIGEGYAIDQLATLIANLGFENFLIELGGEVRGQGAGPSGRPWRIAIQRPSDTRPQVQEFVTLASTAVATSGDYHRYFEHNGRRYSHIIDPATGRPIDHDLASVTVAADSALVADAWDTALLVLGRERGYDRAVKNGLAALFISRADDQFVAQETPTWKQRFPTASNSSPANQQTRSP